MAPPDPSGQGFKMKKDVEPYQQLNIPVDDHPDFARDASKSSLLKRDGSMNKLVEEKQLGP